MSLFKKLQERVKIWRGDNYYCENYPQIAEILYYNKIDENNFRFLRKPQFDAIEVYLYLRFVLKTKQAIDIYKEIFAGDKEALLRALSITHIGRNSLKYIKIDDVLEDIKTDAELVKKYKYQTLYEALNLDYASYILALAMGAGKTILIASIIAIEFAISLDKEESNDLKLMKNALIFAPGKTIIKSLREISDIKFENILPARLFKKFSSNVKINYTTDTDKRCDGVMEGSFYNILVTNTEKIILRKHSKKNDWFKQKEEAEKLTENLRLQKIVSLPNLAIFSDEAHNTYGNALGDNLKRVRETINHIHRKKNIICVINTTGTPYFKKAPLKEVVFWYSLDQGIKDNILKSLQNNIVSYSSNEFKEEQIIFDVIKDFFDNYKDVTVDKGKIAKIAFYFKNEEHLQSCKLYIEKALIKLSLDITQILVNTQKSSKKDEEEFDKLNHKDSRKRIILLINKGKEGWNCPSLFATALIREASSSNNFILQASTRCLRQVIGNNKKAKIYLSTKNTTILNKELKENFNMDISDLQRSDNEKIKEETVFIRKPNPPKLEITKIIKKIIRSDEVNNKKLLLKIPNSDLKKNNLSKTNYSISEKGLQEASFSENIDIQDEDIISIYNASCLIAERYHLSYKNILHALHNIYPYKILYKTHLDDLFFQIENQSNNYKVIEEKIKEVLAIIKLKDDEGNYNFEKDKKGVFYHKIRFKEDGLKEKLLYKYEANKKDTDIGFHLSIYDFDSTPEKSFFEKIFNILNINKGEVRDIYFTGSINDSKKTDIYFEYKDIDGRYKNYYPDFVITKNNGEFLIVEIKARNKETDDNVIAKRKAVEYLENIDENSFKYVVIYADKDIISNESLSQVKDFCNIS